MEQKYPFWVSSTGQGVAQRIISLVALIIPILSLFGINITQSDAEAVINAGLIVVFAIWQTWAWARARFFKQNAMGKFAK